MKPINLDVKRLLGLRVVAEELPFAAGAISAKIGDSKVAPAKNFVDAGERLGAKVGNPKIRLQGEPLDGTSRLGAKISFKEI